MSFDKLDCLCFKIILLDQDNSRDSLGFQSETVICIFCLFETEIFHHKVRCHGYEQAVDAE